MSMVIVLGGAIGAVFVGYPKSKSLKIFQVILSTVQEPKLDYIDAIRTLVSFSEKARREGLLSLEGDISELKDPFMQKGIHRLFRRWRPRSRPVRRDDPGTARCGRIGRLA